MMILISGANQSGKSRYAESVVAQLPQPRYYIATMVAQTAENRQRIEKHRLQRAELGFQTLELPWQLDQAQIEPDSVVLLEDVSNLLANGIFSYGGTREQALQQILHLRNRCGTLLAVTISGLEAQAYAGETAAYIQDLAWLNSQLLRAADQAAELRNGMPVPVK